MPKERDFADYWHWAIPVAFLAYFGLSAACNGGLISVPKGHDARLVGQWGGASPGLTLRRIFTFSADGVWTDGLFTPSRGPRRARWGTENGKLHMKWLATDAWVGKAFPYSVSADGQTLRLERGDYPGHFFPPVLRRLPSRTRIGVR